MDLTPIVCLNGFLGAGKTTTLKHLLENTKGVKVGVIANDVAAINIDSQLVETTISRTNEEESGKETELLSVSLDNGCACCTASDDLFKSLDMLMETKEDIDTVSKKFDKVVIETTGVAEPSQLVQVFEKAKNSGMLDKSRTTLDAMVTVVDVNFFLEEYSSRDRLSNRNDLTGQSEVQGKENSKLMVVDLLVDQVECADLVVLNKLDQISDQKKLEAVKAIIHSLNPQAKIVTTTFGQVDLFTEIENIERPSREFINVNSSVDNAIAHTHGHNHDHEHGECHGCSLDFSSKFGLDSFIYERKRPFHGPSLVQKVLKPMSAAQSSSSYAEILKFGETDNGGNDEDDGAIEINPFSRVIRSKGFVWLSGPQSSVAMYWSSAGKSFGVTPAGLWSAQSNSLPRQQLIFIGENMDKDRITFLLDSALSPEVSEGETS